MQWLASEMQSDMAGVWQGRWRPRRWAGMGLALILAAPLSIAGGAVGGEPSKASEEQLKVGREIFTRDWTPNDPRCHGGDGLGPVYNATSCVACHGQGGPGGAGPDGMNVEVVSMIGGDIADERKMGERDNAEPRKGYFGSVKVWIPGVYFRHGSVYEIKHWIISAKRSELKSPNPLVVSANGITLKMEEFELDTNPTLDYVVLSWAQGTIKAKRFTVRPDDDTLKKIHPGLALAPSATIHHFGVDPGYDEWRSRLRAALTHRGSKKDRRCAGGSSSAPSGMRRRSSAWA